VFLKVGAEWSLKWSGLFKSWGEVVFLISM